MESEISKLEGIFGEIVRCLNRQPEIMSIALGGSRKGLGQIKNSDYDLFCIIKSEKFEGFKKELASLLEREIASIKFCASYLFYRGFGYVYYAISNTGKEFDICLLPFHRRYEFGCLPTNVILKDWNGEHQKLIDRAAIKGTSTPDSYSFNSWYVEGVVLVTTLRLFSALNREKYWVSVRYLNRLLEYGMLLIRINHGKHAKSFFKPETNFSADFPKISALIRSRYQLDGSDGAIRRASEGILSVIATYIDRDRLKTVLKLSEYEFQETII